MKHVHSYVVALMLFCCAFSANAQQILGGNASVSNVKYAKSEDRMSVSMDIIPNGKWEVKSDLSIILTPRIKNNESIVSLPQVKILGRNQYLRHLRNDSEDVAGAKVYQASRTQDIHYEASIPYEEWMDNSELILSENLCGCTQTLLSSDESQINRYTTPVSKPEFKPVFAYIVPKAESMKARSESGQAYVTFHVSKTNIDDAYLNNRKELQKILNSIAMVREDKDVTITGIQLKGHASPEGKHTDNAYLAKGRTEAMADYIRNLSGGMEYAITTDYEAENWDGVRDFINHSDLPEKEELLSIIDMPAFKDNPDAREWKIKSSYPEAYRKLLTDCYPSLRCTDYRIDYTVRSFNLEEAKALIESHPQKLSLQEMYNVAQTYEPGSDAYNEVFNTAVRMFPDDAIANLNAASSALQRNDMVLAEEYLAKAGDSGEAILTRGILAMLKGDAETAVTLIRKAQDMGIEVAASNLEQIQAISK